MKTGLCLFVLLIFLVGFVSASGAVYTIVGEKVLVEMEVTDEKVIVLPEDYFMLELSGEYNLVDNNLIVSKSNVSFFTKSYIQKVSPEYFFLLPNPEFSNIKVYLPENYILSENLAFPKDYDIFTNGKNIIIEWKNFSESEVLLFYKGVEASGLFFYILVGSLIVVFFILFYFQKKMFQKKIILIREKQKNIRKKVKKLKRNNITKNLFGDERKIVDYVLSKKNKFCWTKEIVREMGISKVMASRKIRSLVEKGIVKKESYGNENKISLK